MTPIEVLAAIFAVLVLVKLVVVAVKPDRWMKISEVLLKEGALTTLIYLVLAVIVGYYVLTNLKIVQVAAVMLFTAILIGLAWIPYAKNLDRLREDCWIRM